MKKGIILVAAFLGVLFLYDLCLGSAMAPAPGQELVRPSRSAVFRTMGYCESTRTLMLVFHNGYSYEYEDVPRACWQGLLLAPRKGEYFHRRIRGCYACRRVDPG